MVCKNRAGAGRLVRLGGALALSLSASAAWAQTPPAVVFHPWQAAVPRLTPEAYFTNLQTEAKIETPFLLKFGLSGGWGLAPISKPLGGKSGHHHLLVNRDLPLDFKQALPFNEQYIHFGKGQMETMLNLAPGKYTLRLLLADDKHLPHFVYSKPLVVTVTKNNGAGPTGKKGISLLNLAQNASFKPPFRLQFHASGLNVAHLVQKEKDTGHFRLTMTPRKGAPAEMLFAGGQTEVWLAPPAGDYALKLDFLDNSNPGKVLAEPVTASIRVD
ncbi:MAG TPA: DUF4399 domain-containing protein [Burkholderiaceae bacterium]|nr:DUF4399 domain-containing protein [Burkholderiaceae bacterium]